MNPEVISVNQDASSTAADRIRNDSTTGAQLWARDVQNGDKVIVLYNSLGNHNSKLPNVNITVQWAEIGWGGGREGVKVAVRDLWARADEGTFTDNYTASVGARDVKLLRLTMQKN
jgi:alpha-galactosidase